MLYLRPGETFAGCRIGSVCGSGGTGVVYLAQDALDRQVALKIVALCDAERELEGIRRYIQAAEGQPNLIRIFHAGIEQDCLYYIMEAADRLEGAGSTYIPKTLAAVLDRNGKLAPPAALELVRNLAHGLQILHEHGLVHRDIKPENIVFVGGVPKLCDPGLVCTTEATASFVGTLGYLPQECFDGKNLNTPGRDIYALGKVLYVAITGELPAHYPRIPSDLSVTVRRKLWPLMIRVCDSNPKHRFQTSEEFCRAMPKELPMPNRFERAQETFRQWRLAHPAFGPAMLGALVLAVLAAGTAVHFAIAEQRRIAEERAVCEKACAGEAAKFDAKREMLMTQVEFLAGKAVAEKLQNDLKNLPADPVRRLARYRKLNAALTELAEKHCPEVPEKADTAAVIRLSGKIRGLFASPLGTWMPGQEKAPRLRALEGLERSVYTPEILPGKDFPWDASHRVNYVYVPAGAYRHRDGGIREVPYAFWCADGELREDLFAGNMKRRQQEDVGMPAHRLCWNDVLEYCRNMTLAERARGSLPKGHIIRPLTTREWQWAERGAWSGVGESTAWLKANSGGRVRPARSGEPNGLGLYNMRGNLREMTVPEPETREGNAVDSCGGSYGTETERRDRPTSTPSYQFLDPQIGSRIAVAPGDMDFFDREYRLYDARQIEFAGRRYEVLANNAGWVTETGRYRIAELLGGRLAVPDDPELIRRLFAGFHEFVHFPTAIDGKPENGRWRHPDGTPWRYAPMPEVPTRKQWQLTLYQQKLQCIFIKVIPGMLCEWTAEEYARRTDRERILRSPLVLHSWRDGKKLYCLIDAALTSYMAKRLCELLGGRLAEPRTPEIRARMIRELAKWRDRTVLTGGFYKYGAWRFADGAELGMKLELREKYFDSLNLTVPGLRDGKFQACQHGQAFLAELPLE